MVGLFESVRVDGDSDREGLDVGKVVVDGKVVAAVMTVVAEGSLRQGGTADDTV